MKSFSRLQEVDFRFNKIECDEKVVEFFNLTMSLPNMTVIGWNNGTGYLCRNISDSVQITFKEYYEWYLENYDETEVINEGFPFITFFASSGALLLMGFILGKILIIVL